jgi:hypothetical protein
MQGQSDLRALASAPTPKDRSYDVAHKQNQPEGYSTLARPQDLATTDRYLGATDPGKIKNEINQTRVR